MKGLKLLTPNGTEPVELDELKAFMRVDLEDKEDDILISTCNRASRRYVETFTRRSLLQQTWKMTLDSFPRYDYFKNDSRQTNRIIEIPKSPLISVTSIKYKDTSDTEQTMNLDDFTIDIVDNAKSRITLNESLTYPQTIDNANAVEIEFVAGFQSSTEVSPPDTLRLAIMQLANHYYENRDIVSGINLTNVPKTIDMLLWSERLVTV